MTISSLLPLMLPPNYTSSARPLSDRKEEHTASKTLTEDPETIGILLEPLFRAYITSQADLQLLDTPSGDLWHGGLNEPKYHVDGSVFTGPWGRPQRYVPSVVDPSFISHWSGNPNVLRVLCYFVRVRANVKQRRPGITCPLTHPLRQLSSRPQIFRRCRLSARESL